jgi:hypothetical protein
MVCDAGLAPPCVPENPREEGLVERASVSDCGRKSSTVTMMLSMIKHFTA